MVIDFHSHILPGIDDGSRSVAESIAMLEEEARQGIRTVVATPHFYARYDNPDHFLEKRSYAEAQLREALSRRPDLPEVLVGAEVYYFSGMSDSEVLPQLTIDGKSCILIEMPQSPWTPAMYRELEAVYSKQGLTPVIAHVDRYIRPFRTHGIPEALSRLPVAVQANADFFLQGATRRMALRMLRQNQIQLLGSDCHNLTSRAPNLGDAVSLIRKYAGKEIFRQVYACQEEILADL